MPDAATDLEAWAIDRDLVRRLLACLSDRERYVVLRRRDNDLLREIGADIGVCVDRVRQIEMRAYRKMRARSAALKPTAPPMSDAEEKRAFLLRAIEFAKREDARRAWLRSPLMRLGTTFSEWRGQDDEPNALPSFWEEGDTWQAEALDKLTQPAVVE